MQYQQIFIARDDEVRSAVEREFQKFVVLYIAAGANGTARRHKFSDAAKQSKKLLPVFHADVAIKFLPGKHAGKLVHRVFRDKQLC